MQPLTADLKRETASNDEFKHASMKNHSWAPFAYLTDKVSLYMTQTRFCHRPIFVRALGKSSKIKLSIGYILKPNSNRSPNIFTLVKKVKIGHTKSMLL